MVENVLQNGISDKLILLEQAVCTKHWVYKWFFVYVNIF